MAHPAMQMTAVLTPSDDGGYIALNPETGTTTEGETVESALSNLREAVELYLEEFPAHSFATPLVTTFTVAQHA
jgi:predicted RNase H-like HicB family nuclease